MIDARTPERHWPRPHRRGLVALLLATALATCTSDRPTGPHAVGRGYLAVHPVLLAPASLSSFGLAIDSLRVTLIRSPTAVARDTTVYFNPDSSVLRLLLPVTLQAPTETFTVVIELRAGGTVLYSDSSVAQVSAGGTDSSSVAGDTLRYVGPGRTVKRLLITPTDSVVTLGGAQRFRATATDSSGTPVDSFFVSWSSSAPITAPISKSGLLQAPGARGKVFVRAVTPTSVLDSTSVTFIPVPTSLVVTSGDGQTGGATAKLPLPLRVWVTASDTKGVKGIAVRFQPLTGGGSVRDSVVLSDSLGYAEDSVTLGAAFGPQTFQASVTGLPAVTFGASATGVTIHSADITGDSVWAAAQSPHVVTRYLRIVNGGTLTIQAGAVVKFDSGAGLQVGDTVLNQSGALNLTGAGPGITLTANTPTPLPGFWKGIEVQRNLGLTTWRRALIEWAGGTRVPFGALASEACILFVNRSGAEVDLDSLTIRRCVHAGVHHFGGTSHIHRSEVDSVTGSGIHADLDATLQLDSNTVRGSGQEGLLLGNPATKLSPSRFNRFLGNATFGIQMQAVQLPGLLKQDSIAGNTTDFIAVGGGQPDPTSSAFTIFAQPQRSGSNGYLVSGLLDVGRAGGQTVTLDSNLVLRFATQSGLLIGDSAGTRSASIVSLGTNRTNAPRLTSARLSPAAGDWYGLEVGRLSTNTRLDNVRIEFAGDSIGGRTRHRFGLLVHSPAAQTLALDSVVVVQSGRLGSDSEEAAIGILGSGNGVDVRRSVVQGNFGFGFAVSGVPNVKLVDDTATANTIGFGLFTDSMGISSFTAADSVASNRAVGNTLYPLSIDVRRLSVLYANAFAGNGRDTALLKGGGIFASTATLPHFTGVPWHVPGGIAIDSGGALTIAAGDTLAFDDFTQIQVGGKAVGTLVADGSAAQILLTSSTGHQPGWLGVDWRKPAAAGNKFTFVTVDLAGSIPFVCDCNNPPLSGALRFDDTTAVNLTLDHVAVRRTPGIALEFRRGGSASVSVVSSQFYDNGSNVSVNVPMISATLTQPNQLSITGSDLYAYRRVGVGGGNFTDSIAATNNWWGDVLGPDSGTVGSDSLGRTTRASYAVRTIPFATAPFFPVGTAKALVPSRDSLSPPLSTSVLIGARAVDALGRGVAGVPIAWSAPSGTSITPSAGTADGGGRFTSQWQFTNSAGRKVATATASGVSAMQFVANVQPAATIAANWTLVPALSQGTVTGPKAITFTSTNRRGVIVTNSHDGFTNATQPDVNTLCSSAPGQGCIFVFPPYAQVDSTHTSNGVSGDTIFFHANVQTPSPFVLRAQYSTGSAPILDSVIISMIAIPGGVKIDRDPNQQGVQAIPDTVTITGLCPVGPGNFGCQGTYAALVVDSGLTPIGNGNANFQWNLVSGTAVTFDSQTAVFPHDVGFVTARTNGVARLAVKDISGNNFGVDTLPIRVQQLPSSVLVTPDTVSVLVGATTTFKGTVLDAANDSMALPIHWRTSQFGSHLTIIDTSVARQVTVRLDSTPFGGEFIQAFASSGPDTAYGNGQVLNPVTLQLPVSTQPWAIAANSQTHAVYVGHQGGQLYLLNGTTDNVADSVAAGLTVSAIAVNALTGKIYVGTDQGVQVLNGATLAGTKTIATGTNNQGVTNREGLTVDSIGNRIFVTVSFPLPAPVLRQISGVTDTLVAGTDVTLPDVGGGAVYDAVNGLVYVSIPDSNMVVVIDPTTHTITKRIPVGTTPVALAVNPTTNRVYVVNQGSYDVSVIDGSTQSVLTTIYTGYYVASVAVDAVSNHVYVGVSNQPLVILIDGASNVFFTTVYVGNPSFFDEELGVAFDAVNKKVWTANYSSNTATRLKF